MSNRKTDMAHERKEETNWVITVSLAILAVVALAVVLIYTRTVMIPFVVALFIVALVSPIEDFQVKRLRLPRVIAIIVTLLVVLSVIALASLFVAQAIRTIAYTAGEYSASFASMADKLLKPIEYVYKLEEPPPRPVPDTPKPQPSAAPNEVKPVQGKPVAFELFPLVKDAGGAATLDIRPRSDPPAKDSHEAVVSQVEPNEPPKSQHRIDTRQIVQDLIVNAKQIVRDLANHMFNMLRNTVGAVFGLLSGVLFVCFFVIFLLAGRNPYAEHSEMYVDVVRKIRRYLGTKVITSAAVGVLVWASLALIGMELAGIFGVLAFLLNFIPMIGPTIVTVLPIPIAVAQFQSPWPVVLVVVIPGVIHNVIGNIVEPKLMGEGLDLHPVTILLTLSFWGLLWGIVGMFLATPITAVMRIVLMQFDTFKPIANLLAGDFSKPQIPADAETTPVLARPEGTEPDGSPRG